ncbi:hypothetical protein GCM10007094_13240 [Pseudovibrio japonicus]|uniref:Uncharacterized protein n=1 Tax=Pseudovibrio japonicus TaxID=366534 RepID=A0ABQ3E857_9HYPH|nr:hypothetical protein [Pseudovibrio japonicus]GHB26343.1 hypothetical protein GCM10007094_13240 [Pseudovibrio japonicus]
MFHRLTLLEKLVSFPLRAISYLFIFDGQSRREFAYHYCKIFISRQSFASLSKLRKMILLEGERSAIIAEPTDFHGEVLLGLTNYYVDMDFKQIIVLVTPKQYERLEGAIVHHPNVIVFPLDEIFFNHVFRLRNLKVDSYFLTTLVFRTFSLKRYCKGNPHFAERVCGIVHTLKEATRPEIDNLLKSQRAFLLNNYSSDEGLKEVNTSYFHRQNKQHARQQGDKLRFISVGIRNKKDLFNAFRAVLRVHSDAELVLIARLQPHIPPDLVSNIHCQADKGYDVLFEEVQSSRFILALLDSKEDADLPFLRKDRSKSSGSAQLALGLNRPMIIEEAFAKCYGFTAENAVLYPVGGLKGALMQAANMSEEAYSAMQTELSKLSEEKKVRALESLTYATRN